MRVKKSSTMRYKSATFALTSKLHATYKCTSQTLQTCNPTQNNELNVLAYNFVLCFRKKVAAVVRPSPQTLRWYECHSQLMRGLPTDATLIPVTRKVCITLDTLTILEPNGITSWCEICTLWSEMKLDNIWVSQDFLHRHKSYEQTTV